MRPTISFTRKVKEEIVTKPFSEERLRSLVAAFIKVNGRMEIKNRHVAILLQTENAKIAKFIYLIIQQIYGINVRFSYEKTMKFKKRTTYNIIIDQEAEYIMGDLEISFLEGKIAKSIVFNDDMIGGYLAGAFLASGSVNSPRSSNYHFEIALNDENYAKWFLKLIEKYKGGSFNPKIIKRRDNFVIYLKKSDQIADFLILMGATDASLEFENIRIDREFANIGNRLQNLDTANYAKTMKSSKKQIADLLVIDKILGVNNLANEKQRLLANIRLEHEDATMDELASLMSERLDKVVTKSNINHLFRALSSLAKRYRGEKNED
ncbi:MAG: DNA-binding protein WhiA [Bacilli bacterium]|nr:DNA-binding protein WhiA [Bacilli bacterium]MDD4006327.1 DNA-binding protein WhiA [Bacilli bacterium]